VFPDNSTNYGTAPNLPGSCCIGGNNILSQTSALGGPATSPQVYSANGIALTSGVVTIEGPVILVVSGDVTISGGQIQLVTQAPSVSFPNPAPASLTIFLENGSLSLGDNGIENLDPVPLPKHVAILGAKNTNTAHSIQVSISTTPFYGVIYFPYLPISVTGTNPTFYGSIVGQSVTFVAGTSPTIHYDMELRSPDTITSDAAFGSINSPIAAGNLLQTAGP
jgi:hypothetical protein